MWFHDTSMMFKVLEHKYTPYSYNITLEKKIDIISSDPNVKAIQADESFFFNSNVNRPGMYLQCT